MMRVRLLSCLILSLACMFSAVAFSQSNTLIYSTQVNNGKLNNTDIQALTAHLESIFAMPVRYQAEINDDVTMIVGEGTVPSRFVKSRYPYRQQQQFIKITQPNAEPLAPEAYVNAPVFYQATHKSKVNVESLENAVKLLSRGKLTSVVDLKQNEVAYRFTKQELEYTNYVLEHLIHVYFLEAQLQQKYEQYVLQQDAKRSKTKLDGRTQIDFVRILKSFDSEANTFVPLEDEFNALDWLQNNFFPEFHFNHIARNSADTFELIKTTENTCVINALKNESREQTAIFSNAINIYLPKFLYVRKDNRLTSLLMNNMNFEQLFQRAPKFIVGYWRRSNNEFYDFEISDEQLQRHFVDLSFSDKSQAINYNVARLFEFLDRKRIDGLMEYPDVINEAQNKGFDFSNYKAVALTSISGGRPSYIACSKSYIGQKFTNKLNRLFKSKQFRQAFTQMLYQHYQPSELDVINNKLTSLHQPVN